MIKMYTPVIGPVKGRGAWGSLTYAMDADKDRASNKACQFALIRSGEYEIKRFDEHFIYSDTKRTT